MFYDQIQISVDLRLQLFDLGTALCYGDDLLADMMLGNIVKLYDLSRKDEMPEC